MAGTFHSSQYGEARRVWEPRAPLNIKGAALPPSGPACSIPSYYLESSCVPRPLHPKQTTLLNFLSVLPTSNMKTTSFLIVSCLFTLFHLCRAQWLPNPCLKERGAEKRQTDQPWATESIGNNRHIALVDLSIDDTNEVSHYSGKSLPRRREELRSWQTAIVQNKQLVERGSIPCWEDPNVEKCYCRLPHKLHKTCGYILNNYGEGIEETCESFNLYDICVRKSANYCSGEKPKDWGRGRGRHGGIWRPFLG
jgi:hypothetical protein